MKKSCLFLFIFFVYVHGACHPQSYKESTYQVFSEGSISCLVSDPDCESLRIICQRNSTLSKWKCTTQSAWDKVFVYKILCAGVPANYDSTDEDAEIARIMKHAFELMLCEKPMVDLCKIQIKHTNRTDVYIMNAMLLMLLVPMCLIILMCVIYKKKTMEEFQKVKQEIKKETKRIARFLPHPKKSDEIKQRD